MVHLFQGITVVITSSNIVQKLPEYLSNELVIKANKNNVNDVWIGGSGTDNVNGVGVPISPAESTDAIHVPLMSEIFMAGTKGDKIHVYAYDNPVLDKLNDLIAKTTGQKSFLG